MLAEVYVGNVVADRLAGIGARQHEVPEHLAMQLQELRQDTRAIARRLVEVAFAAAFSRTPSSWRAGGCVAALLPRLSRLLKLCAAWSRPCMVS